MRHVLPKILFPETRLFARAVCGDLGERTDGRDALSVPKEIFAQIAHAEMLDGHALPRIDGVKDGERLSLVDRFARADDEIGAAETALGYEPNTHDIDMEGLEMSMYDMRRLLSVDRDLWLQECSDARAYYEKIGKVPEELYEELDALEMRLNRGYKRK